MDISKDMIPIAPSEHYCMGGIRTDTYGKTGIKGLFACGECACNGIHGANRLASNSLLEGLVFGRIIAMQADEVLNAAGEIKMRMGDAIPEKIDWKYVSGRKAMSFDRAAAKADIQSVMTENIGIVRTKDGLEKALKTIDGYERLCKDLRNESMADCELQNIIMLSKMVVESALEREESRGAHYRMDFCKTDDEKWKRHIILRTVTNRQ